VRQAKDATCVIVVDDALEGVQLTGRVLYLGTTLPAAARAAQVVLPIANVAEEDGTFTNRDGRVQTYRQATAAPGMARPAAWVFEELKAGVAEARA